MGFMNDTGLTKIVKICRTGFSSPAVAHTVNADVRTISDLTRIAPEVFVFGRTTHPWT